MTTTLSNAIVAFESPNAFNSNPSAREFWNSHVRSRVNGWGLIDLESHRISAIKGNSIVHFAPGGSDFNNPEPLSSEVLSSARLTAKAWCRANQCSVTRESILASISEEMKVTVRKIASLRKNVFEAESLDDKVLAHGRMKEQEAQLEKQRLNHFAAEDAVDECIRGGAVDPFASLAHLYPNVVLLIKQLLKKQSVVVAEH
ncbi:hypothetical protein KW843_24685 [Acidovorax sp. sif1233]|jgi:hypothetical protein|uniref:hypothetical protein n=1 Tax=unclassified Acidovorax TaxID=2684926 RepID=UPI0011C3B118|nr:MULTISPECIES: hypothetical protein [unclassified Acidovorax]MBV7457691.1 hypothetical protein [Acidovorax sp. sif1233]